MRPAAADRLGFTAERIAARYPRLVAAMITGWGSRGPWAGYKGYEALIMAKTGVLHSKRQLTPGPDPAYVSVPYASFAAGQTAVHGILAALFERESSGLGQVVEANLVSGVGGHGSRQEAGGTGGSGAGPANRACPLAGVTVLELGGMFAAPFGATALADLGARVIKVEPLDGDAIRGMMAFPEAGGGKVLQGKESIALDIRDHEGLGIVHEIARRCDVMLQCYRAGVAARIGIDEAALKAVNPALVY
jgi:crotonobetainyl-CoA:carnitine CoA-transferase CaiB-like acyl-CoA transferase